MLQTAPLLLGVYSFFKNKNVFLTGHKLKASAGNKLNVTSKQKFIFGWVENIAGNLLFPQCFLPIPRRISILRLHFSHCLQIL